MGNSLKYTRTITMILFDSVRGEAASYEPFIKILCCDCVIIAHFYPRNRNRMLNRVTRIVRVDFVSSILERAVMLFIIIICLLYIHCFIRMTSSFLGGF